MYESSNAMNEGTDNKIKEHAGTDHICLICFPLVFLYIFLLKKQLMSSPHMDLLYIEKVRYTI